MGNTLKMEKQEIINQLIEKGWSNRKINRATEIDRRTISKYRRIRSEREKQESDSDSDKQEQTYVNQEVCNSNQNAPLLGTNKCPPTQVVRFKVPPDSSDTSGKSSKSKAAIHDKQIRKKLKKGQNGKSIYQDLYAEEDYRGSYDSVKRYVRKLKRTSPKLYARIETPPGEEGQVDFGQGAPTLKNGRYLKPWLFVMTLSFSRKSYEEVVWSQDVETFIRCHKHAFEHFGGVPGILLHDNLKSGVLTAHLYEPELNPNYKAFANHYGFVPIPCKVRTPEHKGKVEAGVKYAQNNALKGKNLTRWMHRTVIFVTGIKPGQRLGSTAQPSDRSARCFLKNSQP